MVLGVGADAPLPPPDPFTETAERRVSLGLLVNAVMDREKLELDRDRVRTKVNELAAGHPQADQVARAYMSDPHLIGQIEAVVLEDQVVDWLLEQARIKDRSTSFKELMNFEVDR